MKRIPGFGQLPGILQVCLVATGGLCVGGPSRMGGGGHCDGDGRGQGIPRGAIIGIAPWDIQVQSHQCSAKAGAELTHWHLKPAKIFIFTRMLLNHWLKDRITVSLHFQGSYINHRLWLIQIVAWHWADSKPLPELIVITFSKTCVTRLEWVKMIPILDWFRLDWNGKVLLSTWSVEVLNDVNFRAFH